MKSFSNMKVKDQPAEDRPRERLLAKGRKELTNAELLAILIRSGSTQINAVDLAKRILSDVDNNLVDLSRMDIGTLVRQYNGIGEAKAITIIAALELGIRMLNDNQGRTATYMTDSMALFNYISDDFINLSHEEFWAVYLNTRNKIIYKQRISSGGINTAPVDIRIIFRTAVEKSAVAVALAHNHPTGDVRPSKEDKTLTTKIIQAGETLNITVLDHIIVGLRDDGRPDYYSFHDEGLL